jgi:hypothetical protein
MSANIPEKEKGESKNGLEKKPEHEEAPRMFSGFVAFSRHLMCFQRSDALVDMSAVSIHYSVSFP